MSMVKKLLGIGLGVALTTAMGIAQAAAKPEITIGYVDGWADSVATTFTAATVIREKLGYEVKLMPVAAGIMWQGVARGPNWTPCCPPGYRSPMVPITTR
ncbi:ABC-type proline/glycine betaine transport system substrate-binding protein [Pseudomonas psychrotolerans]|nr:ABC-type proline/glycine betaine transport system substrate-binding protein [Pseudomonas psychrotolerans]